MDLYRLYFWSLYAISKLVTTTISSVVCNHGNHSVTKITFLNSWNTFSIILKVKVFHTLRDVWQMPEFLCMEIPMGRRLSLNCVFNGGRN